MKTQQLLSSFFLPELQRPEFIRRLGFGYGHGPAVTVVRSAKTY